MRQFLIMGIRAQVILYIAVLAALLVGGVLRYEHQKLMAYYAAAEEGDVQKQVMLGIYYYRGDPFSHSYKKAMMWFRRAADQGDAEAEFDLGHMYWYGEGIATDSIEAY